MSDTEIEPQENIEHNIAGVDDGDEVEFDMRKTLHEEEDDPDANNGGPKKYLKVDTHTKVVATHYNALEEKGLIERSKSRILYMRNFNNWIKSMLINEYLTKIKENSQLGAPLRVMDMCCGKGGDLLKWQKGNITHLICTDIADVSVEQCESRYKTRIARNDNGNKFNQPFTAEFFACDSTLVRLREKFADPSIKLNLVSCQFAFHYCFESIKQAECMLRNAAECLLAGGYFIGTIPNAYEIMRRQREAGCDTFGNDVYKISFECDTADIPLFGAKYDFHLEGVVDCPEFLVHFPTLVKLARKYGLELEKREDFPDYYQRIVSNGRGLIEKMQALETYPPFTYNDLGSSKSDDYEHADKYLKTANWDRNNRLKKIGTLSNTEWDVISLYTLFVFRKVKSTWNAEGKPEYEFSN